MARTHSVALYMLKVRQPPSNKKDSYKETNLHDKNGNAKNSFYDFLVQFAKKYSGKLYEDSPENLLRIKTLKIGSLNPFYVNGIVEKGDSGISSILHDTKTHSEKTRTVLDAELFPYYFCIAETADPTAAILCLGRTGNVGVKTLFQDALKNEFKAFFSDKLKLTIEDYLPGFSKEQFIKNNKVRKVSYTFLTRVNDVASLLEVEGKRTLEVEDALITVTIKPRRGIAHALKETSDSIKSLFPKLNHNIVNLDDTKKIETSITFENQDGQTRTFSIDENKDALPYISLEKMIEKGADGHPVFESIALAVHDILVRDNILKSS